MYMNVVLNLNVVVQVTVKLHTNHAAQNFQRICFFFNFIARCSLDIRICRGLITL